MRMKGQNVKWKLLGTARSILMRRIFILSVKIWVQKNNNNETYKLRTGQKEETEKKYGFSTPRSSLPKKEKKAP